MEHYACWQNTRKPLKISNIASIALIILYVTVARKVNVTARCAYGNINLPGNWRHKIVCAQRAEVKKPQIIRLSPSAPLGRQCTADVRLFTLAALVTQCTISRPTSNKQ